MRPLRIALFASGSGSNAEALIKKIQSFGADKAEVSFVLSDQKEAGVLQRAKNLDRKSFILERQGSKLEHEDKILNLLKEHKIDWVFLAGYMRILSPSFIQKFSKWHGGASQIVNIHPSLLPAYPGARALERAFEDKVSHSGVSLHCVDEGVDTGPILMQASLQLNPEESFESWKLRVHELEHRLYQQLAEEIILGHRATVFFKENEYA